MVVVDVDVVVDVVVSDVVNVVILDLVVSVGYYRRRCRG